MKILSLLLAAIVVATPAAAYSWICGTTSYDGSNIQNAINDGYSKKDLSKRYPHTFNNYERLNFLDECKGKTLIEYPLTKKTYTGKSPGADRVVYLSDKTFCGCITHTGASGNNFVSCRELVQ